MTEEEKGNSEHEAIQPQKMYSLFYCIGILSKNTIHKVTDLFNVN